MFIIGVVGRSYFWLFALLLDPFDIYNKFLRQSAWPPLEVSPMWFWIVLTLSVLWTAILTYHELRMRTVPYSEKEADLRDEFLEFLRRKMLPAFTASNRLAVFMGQMHQAKAGDRMRVEIRDSIQSITARCSPNCAPLLEVIDRQWAGVFSLVELERIFAFAYQEYDTKAINMQAMCSIFEPPSEDIRIQWERHKNSYLRASREMREELSRMSKAGKFKIIPNGERGPFSGPQYSEYHLLNKEQQRANRFPS